MCYANVFFVFVCSFRNAAAKYWERKYSFDWIETGPIDSGVGRKRANSILRICSRMSNNLESLHLSFSLPYDWNEEFSFIGQRYPNIKSVAFDSDDAYGYYENRRCPM